MLRANDSFDKLRNLAFRGQLPFLLASVLINLAVLWALALVPRQTRMDTPAAVIPVTMVAKIPVDPPPAADERASDAVEATPKRAVQAEVPPQQTPERPISRPSVQSPVTALDGEASDATPVLPGPASSAEADFPVLTEPTRQVSEALKAFQCAKAGAPKPNFCGSVQQITLKEPSLSPEPVLPTEWASFVVERRDPAIQRLQAEGCPPQDGVIRDVFTQDTTSYRQGAHAGVGSLAAGSVNKSCP